MYNTRAAKIRAEELEVAEAIFNRADALMREGSSTVDGLRALCRDAETAYRQYLDAVILLKEAL